MVGEGLADKYLGQFGVGKTLGYPHHVVVELAFGIAAHVHRRFLGGRHVGNQGLDVFDAVEGEADDAAGEVGVAAPEVLGSLLHHQNRAANFLGCQGGAEGGVAGADYNYVIRFISIAVGQAAPPRNRRHLGLA